MLGIHEFWLFIISGLLLNVTPGPDTAYIVGRSVQLGWRGVSLLHRHENVAVAAASSAERGGGRERRDVTASNFTQPGILAGRADQRA
jgi:hypothetical protein